MHFLFSFGLAIVAMTSSLAAAQVTQPSMPTPLSFMVVPFSAPMEIYDGYTPVLSYVERKVPGIRFKLDAVIDFNEFEKRIVDRRADFAIGNPAHAILAMQNGYHVIAKALPDDSMRGVFVVRADSGINSINELQGRLICMSSPTALGGSMMTMLALHDAGVPNAGVKAKYVGSFLSALTNAHAGKCAAAAVTKRFVQIWSRRFSNKVSEMKVIHETDPIPHLAVLAKNSVPAKIEQQVVKALLGIHADPEVDHAAFRLEQGHYEKATDDTYRKTIPKILRRYDEIYGLPESMKTLNLSSR